MKTWKVKTIVGPDHKVTFNVPDDIPEGPLEMVVVIQAPKTIEELGWTKEQAAETRSKLMSFDQDWNAPGMEAYDAFDFLKKPAEDIYSPKDGRPFDANS